MRVANLRYRKSLAEQSGLPELVGHVLADVDHGAVRSDDDLLARFGIVLFAFGGRPDARRAESSMLHHPAAGVLAVVLQVDRAGLLQHLERARPELQPQDVAFPRQQLVVDVEPRHRLQMRAHDGIGNERGEARRGIDAVFDVVQRRGANLQPLLVALVPLGDARVEIPAVVVESRRRGDAPGIVERRAVRAAGSRRPRRRPARRCRRCSSALRPGCRGSSARARACRRAPSCEGGRCAPPCSD